VPQAAPDIRLEVGGHLGHWEFAAWDKRRVELHHDTETLMGTTGLAVFIAVLALGLYGHQRRTQLEAERRVTFVNRVSHELRSPLTNILLHLDLAAELSDEESSGARRSLGLVREEANRLARLIQNVLTFSRREHGRQPGRASVCVPDTVVSQVLEGFAAAFLRRGIRVGTHLNANSACLIDADALAQILGNLFSNAEKYAPHSEVCVRSEWQKGHLKLHVADTGPGIPVEAAARVFEPFERLNDRLTEGVSGTGLGLAIAQDLTEGMGGSLRLETGGEGARFVLEIPAPPAPALEVVG
jgi:signal transduction histidine kinase